MLSVDRLFLFASPRPWPVHQTHGRRETKDSGVSKWYGTAAADVSAAGTDKHSYAIASARQCKCGCFSLPLQGTRKTLRFWLIVRPYPMAGLGYPILPGRQSRPLVARHICILTGVLWRRRPSCCTPFCVPVLPRRRLVVQRRPTWGRGHGDAPARRPGADRPFRIPGHAPSVGPSPGRFATFWVRHCPLCRSINGVLASAGNSVGSQPAIPPLRTYHRSNSNHAGKSYVLGRNRESQIATCEVANA